MQETFARCQCSCDSLHATARSQRQLVLEGIEGSGHLEFACSDPWVAEIEDLLKHPSEVHLGSARCQGSQSTKPSQSVMTEIEAPCGAVSWALHVPQPSTVPHALSAAAGLLSAPTGIAMARTLPQTHATSGVIVLAPRLGVHHPQSRWYSRCTAGTRSPSSSTTQPAGALMTPPSGVRR